MDFFYRGRFTVDQFSVDVITDYVFTVPACARFQAQQIGVLEHCVNAEPHHGELWCSVSKHIENWRLKTRDILPLAANSLQIPT